MALTTRQIEEAIHAKNGNVTHVAEALGVSRTAIYKRINNSERLQAALEDARETIVDLAESKLDSDNESIRVNAAKEVLDRTTGKPAQRVQSEISGKDGGPVETTIRVVYEDALNADD